jgi:hypothetical protein
MDAITLGTLRFPLPPPLKLLYPIDKNVIESLDTQVCTASLCDECDMSSACKLSVTTSRTPL